MFIITKFNYTIIYKNTLLLHYIKMGNTYYQVHKICLIKIMHTVCVLYIFYIIYVRIAFFYEFFSIILATSKQLCLIYYVYRQ